MSTVSKTAASIGNPEHELADWVTPEIAEYAVEELTRTAPSSPLGADGVTGYS